MFPVSKYKPYLAAPLGGLEEVCVEDAALELCTWANALADLIAAIEAAGYAIDNDLSSELGAFFQCLEDAGLSLDTIGTSYDDLTTWMAAYYVSLGDNLPFDLQTVAMSLEHLLMALQTVATGYVNLSMPLISYGQGLTDLPALLQAAGYHRQNLASYLAAASSTVLASLAAHLAATDGTTLTSLGLSLIARSRPPSFTALIAQRVSAVATEVS